MNIVVANGPRTLDTGQEVILFPSRWDSGNLRNMTPSCASDNLLNTAFGDVELTRQSPLTAAFFVKATNLRDLFSSEFCKRMILAVVMPFFGYLIGHVVGLCAKKQMIGVDASAVVALVEYAKSLRDGAIGKCVGIAVGCAMTVIGFSRKQAISVPVFSASPQPAFIGAALVNACPETFNQSWGKGSVGGMILHVDTFLSRFGQSRGRLQRRSAISIGFTPVSIPQAGGIYQ